jgi:glycosyltransferase involved in cell wall biosynthesis
MIKVMHICSDLGSGGVEKLLRQWYPIAKSNNIQFSFTVYREGGEAYNYFSNEGSRIIKINRLTEIGIFSFCKQLIKVFKDEKVDIVHVPSAPTASLILLSAKMAGVKVRLIHAHTNLYNVDNGKFINSVMVKMFSVLNVFFATKLLTGSKEAANYCFGNDRIRSKKKVETIYNGIDISRFSFKSKLREEKRQELGIENKFIVGSVGRLTYQKNTEFIIEIFYELLKKNKDCLLFLIGEGEDKEILIKKATELGINDKVMFLGIFENLSPWYHVMDAFIFPSRYEGLGIAAIEAQTTGLQAYLSNNVPLSAGITKNVHFISIDKGGKYWAEEIWKNHKKVRADCSKDAINSGYDSNSSIIKMIKIYIGEYKKTYKI